MPKLPRRDLQRHPPSNLRPTHITMAGDHVRQRRHPTRSRPQVPPRHKPLGAYTQDKALPLHRRRGLRKRTTRQRPRRERSRLQRRNKEPGRLVQARSKTGGPKYWSRCQGNQGLQESQQAQEDGRPPQLVEPTGNLHHRNHPGSNPGRPKSHPNLTPLTPTHTPHNTTYIWPPT